MSYRHAASRLLLSAVIGLGGGGSLSCSSKSYATDGQWPNEPPQLPLITEYGFEDPLPVGHSLPVGDRGWAINNELFLATLATDSGAPLSPPSVARWQYPAGFVAGSAPATMYYLTPQSLSEVYFGFWWKPSDPWQFNSSNSKIAFVFAGGGDAGGQMFISMTASARLRCATEFTDDARNLEPNVNATVITLGKWHRIELYMNKATRTLRWWMDGVPQGDYRGIRFPVQRFDMVQFSPTWGGVDGVKTQTDYYWYDHVRISGR